MAGHQGGLGRDVTAPLAGIFPVLMTPFRADGALDEASLDRQVDRVAARDVHGLVLFGLASEVFKLTEAERERIAARVVERVGGRLPVIAGVEHNGTLAAADLARRMEGCGVNALMSLPPTFVKPGPDGLFRYYGAIAEATAIPIVIQDAPGATGVAMPAPLLARMVNELPRVDYVKVEAPPTAPKIAEIARLTGGRAKLFGGLGGRYFLQELRAGAVGTMPGPAFPDALTRVQGLFHGGREAEAEAEFFRILPALVFSEGNDQLTHLTKQLFWRDGTCAEPTVREPTAGVDDRLVQQWLALLEGLGLASTGAAPNTACVA